MAVAAGCSTITWRITDHQASEEEALQTTCTRPQPLPPGLTNWTIDD